MRQRRLAIGRFAIGGLGNRYRIAGLRRPISREFAWRERGLEPIIQKLIFKEIQCPLFLILLVSLCCVVDDIDRDSPALDEVLESYVYPGLEEVVLTGKACAELIIDSLEIRLDLDVKSRSQDRELEVVDNANRSQPFLEGLFDYDRSFLV